MNFITELIATVVPRNKIAISGYKACILGDKCLFKCNDHLQKFHDKKKLLLQVFPFLNWKLKISKFSKQVGLFLCFVMPLSIGFDVLFCVFVINHNYFHFYNLRFPKRKVVKF